MKDNEVYIYYNGEIFEMFGKAEDIYNWHCEYPGQQYLMKEYFYVFKNNKLHKMFRNSKHIEKKNRGYDLEKESKLSFDMFLKNLEKEAPLK